jgi:hypothetical protein
VPSLQVGYVWHAGVHAAEVALGLERIGFEIVAQVIWDKTLFAMGRSWYHWAHEPCWVTRKPGVPHLFLGSHDQSTIWRAPSPKMIMGGSEEEKQDHPTQKPVLLFETPIANHLEAGAAVYDPFVGSGTCLIAAEHLGRRCYAMEIDPRYVQVAKERWERFTGRKAVLSSAANPAGDERTPANVAGAPAEFAADDRRPAANLSAEANSDGHDRAHSRGLSSPANSAGHERPMTEAAASPAGDDQGRLDG